MDKSYHWTEDDGTKHKGLWIAMLDEESIFKSLHCNMKSDVVTPLDISAQAIDGALREWFFYGKGVYTQRLNQMKKVVEENDLIHIIHPSTLHSYDQREQSWLDRYNITKKCNNPTMGK